MRKVFWIAVMTLLVQVPAVFADTTDPMMDILQKMQKQMAGMQNTIDAQNLRIQQLESKKVLETPQPSVGLQPAAQAAATMSDKDFQASLKDNIGKVIPWLEGAKYGGDFRLRMENFDYFDKNLDNGATDRTRNRFRFRLRWGFEKDFKDDWKMGFALASGSTTDPNSTNQTLGNGGYFNKKTLTIDKAYATYEPNGLKDYGLFKGVKIGAGKFNNPFLRYSTPIVWDGDVNPEGIYEQATLQLLSSEDTKVNLYSTLGQFLVNENSSLDTDAQVYGYQGALNVSTYNFGTETPVSLTSALSYYDYTNWFQTVKSNTASTSYLRTNSIVADDFRVLDFYPEIQFSVNHMPVTLWYDYATNLANVGTADVAQSSGNDIHDADEAWGLGFKLGKAKKKGSWEAHYGYYEIGANAVVAAFSDSDFGGPGSDGYTNRKGHKFGLGYQLTDNLTLNWTGYVVRPLNPFTGNAVLGVQTSANEHVFRSQLDAVYKF